MKSDVITPSPLGPSQEPVRNSEGTRVLVIENDLTARLDIVEVLRDQGYLVEQAAHGREALEVLERCAIAPSVILLDLRTPVMNGWEFVGAQRSLPKHAAIPVIVMSGDPDIAHHARSLSASGYLRKPFGLDALLDAVSRGVPTRT